MRSVRGQRRSVGGHRLVKRLSFMLGHASGHLYTQPPSSAVAPWNLIPCLTAEMYNRPALCRLSGASRIMKSLPIMAFSSTPNGEYEVSRYLHVCGPACQDHSQFLYNMHSASIPYPSYLASPGCQVFAWIEAKHLSFWSSRRNEKTPYYCIQVWHVWSDSVLETLFCRCEGNDLHVSRNSTVRLM